MQSQTDWDDVAFLRSTPNSPWICAVTKQYKLVYSSVEEPWLIDVQNDPKEVTNLFTQKEHAARIKELTAKLFDYCRAHQDEHARIPSIQQQIKAVLN